MKRFLAACLTFTLVSGSGCAVFDELGLARQFHKPHACSHPGCQQHQHNDLPAQLPERQPRHGSASTRPVGTAPVPEKPSSEAGAKPPATNKVTRVPLGGAAVAHTAPQAPIDLNFDDLMSAEASASGAPMSPTAAARDTIHPLPPIAEAAAPTRVVADADMPAYPTTPYAEDASFMRLPGQVSTRSLAEYYSPDNELYRSQGRIEIRLGEPPAETAAPVSRPLVTAPPAGPAVDVRHASLDEGAAAATPGANDAVASPAPSNNVPAAAATAGQAVAYWEMRSDAPAEESPAMAVVTPQPTVEVVSLQPTPPTSLPAPTRHNDLREGESATASGPRRNALR